MSPVEVYCEPCMKDWTQNGSRCYLFNIIKPWLTWTDSQIYCAERGGHLAVIDTSEKQASLHKIRNPSIVNTANPWQGNSAGLVFWQETGYTLGRSPFYRRAIHTHIHIYGYFRVAPFGQQV